MTGPHSSASILTPHRPTCPTAASVNAGWWVQFNDQPLHLPGRHGVTGDIYSIGLQLGEDGTVGDSIVGGVAFQAGISPGMKVVGVNGRVYTRDLLEDAIKAAKDTAAPITLLVLDDDYYRTVTIEYHGGERYPHLVRNESKPDYLSDLIKPRAGQ